MSEGEFYVYQFHRDGEVERVCTGVPFGDAVEAAKVCTMSEAVDRGEIIRVVIVAAEHEELIFEWRAEP
jgi:hypothetical protein